MVYHSPVYRTDNGYIKSLRNGAPELPELCSAFMERSIALDGNSRVGLRAREGERRVGLRYGTRKEESGYSRG